MQASRVYPIKMKLLILLVVTVVASASAKKAEFLSEQFINELNKEAVYWEAGRNFDENLEESEVLKLFGAEDAIDVDELPLKEFSTADENDDEIPEQFDARESWPHCTTIPSIKEQSYCMSCWAVSVASVMSDRLCIETAGAINVNISSEELLSCCKSCGRGCKGGKVAKAWQYAQKQGLVTGGDYSSNEGCQPYEIKPCGGDKGECPKKLTTPKCHKSECTNKKYKTPFSKDGHKFDKIYKVLKNEADIQREIMTNGPVVAVFDVYEDFISYKRGIYRYQKGKKLGQHAVKIIGWGTCPHCKMHYWNVINSWGTEWGEQGTFKVLRGLPFNKVNFESRITAGAASTYQD